MIELKNVQWGQIRLADIFDEIPRGKAVSYTHLTLPTTSRV